MELIQLLIRCREASVNSRNMYFLRYEDLRSLSWPDSCQGKDECWVSQSSLVERCGQRHGVGFVDGFLQTPSYYYSKLNLLIGQ